MDVKSVAVIGSGVAGLGAAWLLAQNPDKFRVTLLEGENYFGGHSHTVQVSTTARGSGDVAAAAGGGGGETTRYPPNTRIARGSC